MRQTKADKDGFPLFVDLGLMRCRCRGQVLGEVIEAGAHVTIRCLHTLVRCFPNSVGVLEPVLRWMLTPIFVAQEEYQQVSSPPSPPASFLTRVAWTGFGVHIHVSVWCDDDDDDDDDDGGGVDSM